MLFLFADTHLFYMLYVVKYNMFTYTFIIFYKENVRGSIYMMRTERTKYCRTLISGSHPSIHKIRVVFLSEEYELFHFP